MIVQRCPLPPGDPDRLSPREWRAWIDHLDACAGCRAAWLAADPTRQFAWLADDPIPQEVLEGVSRAVSEALAEDGRAAVRRAAVSRRWVPATIAAGILAAALTSGVFRETDRATPEPVASVPIVLDRPNVSTRADVSIHEPGEGVRVVDMTVGDRQVVMIFDEAMKL